MRLSFLITYHNEGAWLSECLGSVLPQLGEQDEVLVYDDASDIAATDFAGGDPRVRCLRGDVNVGPARARNQLLRASRGTHVHFHDADDLCAPSWRASVAAAFDGAVDVVFTDAGSCDEAGGRWQHIMNVAQLQRTGDLLAFALCGGVLVPAGTYRRELVDEIGGYRADLWQSEDYDFHIRLALAMPRWHAIAADLVQIRRHARQRSRDSRAVWACAVASLEQNAAAFPRVAYADVARAATRAGSRLFAAGAMSDASRAFALAERFGGVRYDRSLMQGLTRFVSPLSAEKFAAAYRKLIPAALRSRVQRTGW